jgi:penicillin-binding protein 1A
MNQEVRMQQEPNAKPRKVVVVNRSKGGWLVKLFLITAVLVILAGLAALGAAAWIVHDIKSELPNFSSISEYEPVMGTRVYAQDGTQIAEFAVEKREVVGYEKIPPRLVLAFIAAEDANFFNHHGFDPYYFTRAVVKNLKAGGFKEGASTITMQVARTFFLSREKKLLRKLKEIILAMFILEENLSKEDILWLYLNQIYLGHGAYGVQAASHTYFNKDVWELSLDEMAVLAGLPKAPGRDSPYRNLERATGRKRYVLRRMLEERFITKTEHDEALARPITLHPSMELFWQYAPHYSEHVRKYLYDKYGETELYKGGMHVVTAMNIQAQKYAQDALYYGLRSLDHRQGYRGPLAKIPADRRAEFLETLKTKYGDGPLERKPLYIALVTQVDDRKDEVHISLGAIEGVIPISTMRWARKPDPEGWWGNHQIKHPSQALSAGDVIYVRATDRDSVEKDLFWRLETPIDTGKLIFILEQEPKAQASIVSKDPQNGYTVAMVGGYAYEKSEFNRAYQACRQPGSAFKPLVYTAAIEKGWNVSTVILDAPIVDGEMERKWKPENYEESFKGEVSVRFALQHSLNIPAIKTLDYAGIERIKELSQRMGIRTNIQEDRSISLGSACLTVADLVDAYSAYPNGGRKTPTVYVTQILNQKGEILEDNRAYYDITLDIAEKLDRMEAAVLAPDHRVMPETTAFIMTWLLKQVIQGGTGSAAMALGLPTGGKTGTTNDSYDAWFVGFTPHLTTGVWIGHDDNSRPLGVKETGGQAALPIWLDFMKRTLKHAEPVDFPDVPGIHWVQVDRKTGRRAVEGATQTISAPFKIGTEPTETMIVEGEQNPDEFYKLPGIY